MVFIPDADRGTLCVSSQVGCTLNCTFCHTGTMRLVRNLTAGEIVGQDVVRLAAPHEQRGLFKRPGRGDFLPHGRQVGHQRGQIDAPGKRVVVASV